MELIEIVDEKGEFTGKVIDKDEVHKKNLLHNEVGCFLINDKGQTLLQKRSGKKKFSPNKWRPCAGHVKAYESLEEAMIRELKEELGILFSQEELKILERKKIEIFPKNSHVTYFYYLRTNLEENQFTIQKEELDEIKWFPFKEGLDAILLNEDSYYKEKYTKLFEKLERVLKEESEENI